MAPHRQRTPGLAATTIRPFAILVISGLVGLRPRDDDTVEVRPLVPSGDSGKGVWDWFCLDQHPIHDGKILTILWDQLTGTKI